MNESISIIEACDFLKCSQAQLLQMLDGGQVPGLNFGTAWVIPRLAFFEAVNTLAFQAAGRRRGAEDTPPPSSSRSTTDVATAPTHVGLDGHSDKQAYAQEFMSSIGMSVEFEDSETQKRSRVIESYLHDGIAILIYEFTGRTPYYFGVVADPDTKRQSGELIGSSYSITKTKKAAEAFALTLATKEPPTSGIAIDQNAMPVKRGPGRPRRPRSTLIDPASMNLNHAA